MQRISFDRRCRKGDRRPARKGEGKEGGGRRARIEVIEHVRPATTTTTTGSFFFSLSPYCAPPLWRYPISLPRRRGSSPIVSVGPTFHAIFYPIDVLRKAKKGVLLRWPCSRTLYTRTVWCQSSLRTADCGGVHEESGEFKFTPVKSGRTSA